MNRSLCLLVLCSSLLFGSLVCGLDLDRGNEELKAALDRAAVIAYQKGKWAETLGQEEGVNLPFICGDWHNLNLYPQPNPNELAPNGALADVLQRQVLNAAYITTLIQLTKYDGSNITGINTTDPQAVTGVFSAWHHHLAAELSTMYNKPITLNYIIHETPTEALHAVVTGEAHMAITPFRTDLTYNGHPRTYRFLSGCPDNGLTTGQLYQSEPFQRFNSYSEILESAGHTIGALNTNCNVYKMTFVEANVECVDNTTVLEDGLYNRRFDAVSESVLDSIMVPGSLPATAFGSFYRTDNPCDPPTEISAGNKLGMLWSVCLSVLMGWLLAF
uniref:Solute-binding protein family 3/N-terminal domain-containing protein n=1 Tax=Paramoeba aestuarina TaxID=180227 RepID=A0A7S4KUK1_9EUKA